MRVETGSGRGGQQSDFKHKDVVDLGKELIGSDVCARCEDGVCSLEGGGVHAG